MQKSKIIILAAVSLVVIGGGIIWRWQSENWAAGQANEQLRLELEKRNAEPEVPDVLKTLTIPYLRARNYESALKIEPEIVEETAEWASYIAKYESDGYEIEGLLAIPKGAPPEGGWPAIVFVHGYQNPEIYESNGRAYRNYWQPLARAGLVVFKIDLRGHGESEGEAGGGYFGSDYVIDTLNARAALMSSGTSGAGADNNEIGSNEIKIAINPEKIGMWGHSMAGNILLRAMAARPNEIPAAVIWAGAVYSYEDLMKYGITDNTYVRPSPTPRLEAQDGVTMSARRNRPNLRAMMQENPEILEQIAPTNYLPEIKGAIEIHHAVDDQTVSVNYSRDLVILMETAGNNYQYFEYQSGDHNIAAPSFDLAMQRTIEFFNSQLF